MDFGAPSVSGPMFALGPMSVNGGNSNPDRIIGIDITFTCPGTNTIRRSFLRSDCTAVHLGREPADIAGVANAFLRSDVVPPVMSRKHAEIMFDSETPQVMDTGSYHGTYFRESGQRLLVNKPYLLADGSVLEFGKSVTKDDKAHEPLLATIKFLHESDRDLDRARYMVTASSCPFPAPSPPRRYSVPSDSEDEDEDESDEDEDEDTSSRSDVFEYTPQPAHIDLTSMSDDGKSSMGEDGDGIECVGFGYSRNSYEEESVSSSDMSESEFEEEVGKVVTPPSGAMNEAGPSSSGHGLITPPVELVAPAPIPLPRLPRLETALSGLQEYHALGFYPLDLPNFVSRPPMEERNGMDWYTMNPHAQHVQQQVRREPEVTMARPRPEPPVIQAPATNEEMVALKTELEAAHTLVAELKRSLAEKEAEKQDQDGDVTIVAAPAATEPIEAPTADDLPTLVANIERMMGELAMVEDNELVAHLRPVLHLLAMLPTEREKLWRRVGHAAMGRPNEQGIKRKRDDEDEGEDVEVESRRAQSPMPESVASSTPEPAPEPSAAPSPTKRMRFNPFVGGAVVGGAAMWGALAFGAL